MTTLHKVLCSALLILLWAVFVFLGQAPVDPLIATIRDALVALGVFSATMTNPKG